MALSKDYLYAELFQNQDTVKQSWTDVHLTDWLTDWMNDLPTYYRPSNWPSNQKTHSPIHMILRS